MIGDFGADGVPVLVGDDRRWPRLAGQRRAAAARARRQRTHQGPLPTVTESRASAPTWFAQSPLLSRRAFASVARTATPTPFYVLVAPTTSSGAVNQASGGAETSEPALHHLDTAPVEDAGRDTATWYGYQYTCAARDCLLMLTDGPVDWVLCEWHTDFVRGRPSGVLPAYTLVSIKHRDPDQGAWKLSDLPTRGGLATLLLRWREAGRHPDCAWTTNGGLRPGNMEARNLATTLESPACPERSAVLRKYAALMRPGLGADDDAEAADFLNALTIKTTGGDRFSLRAQTIEEVARPVLESLGISTVWARETFDAAVNLVSEAMRGFDHENPPDTWLLAGDDLLSAQRIARTVTRERLLAQLNGCGVPIPRVGSVGGGGATAMIRKLRAGGLGPSVLAAAPRIRQRWFEVQSSFRLDLPSPIGDEVQRLRVEVARLAGRAESSSRVAGTAYGPRMHTELEAHLSTGLDAKLPVGQTELLGLAYQLTDECDVWWSDPFDPSSEAPWLAMPSENLERDAHEPGPNDPAGASQGSQS